MNEMMIIPFNFDDQGVRVVERNGEPWFVAKDVALALGYVDTDQAIRQHCKGAETCPVGSTGQLRQAKIIPERDLYRLVMRSQAAGAERFEEWVVSEVLPSIRQHGGYIAGQEQDDPEIIMAKALQVAQSVIERKSLELQHAKATIALQAPKAAFADRIAGADKGTLIGNFAKTVGLGPKQIFMILRELRILMVGGNRHNLPFQEYLDRGYFAVAEKPYEVHGETRLGFQPLITGKGQQWLTKRLLDAGYLKGVAA